MIEKDLVYKIRVVAFDIFNNTVGKWPEEAFENMMFDALLAKGLKVERQKEFEVYYKGTRVGLYRTDLAVENLIVIELKSVPEIFPLHQAQTISYLKATGLPIAMLINFGGNEIYMKAFPNKFKQELQELVVNRNMITTGIGFKQEYLVEDSFKKQLRIDFDINKLDLSRADKALILPYLEMSKEILEILGPGYFHQVYRRAFWEELYNHNIGFEWINKMELKYKNKIYGRKDLKFYKINKLLIAILAINGFTEPILKRFSSYVKYYRCEKGLMINFNSVGVDFRYLK